MDEPRADGTGLVTLITTTVSRHNTVNHFLIRR